MQKIARSDGQPDMDEILKESRRLHIPPMDLILGILQPLLVEIGELWVTGQVTVATEHRFSELVSDLMVHIRIDRPGDPSPASPHLILINAEGNAHFLGLMMAEYFFKACGIPTFTVIPGVPINDIMELLALHKPQALGVSVALPSQMNYVQEVAREIRSLKDPPVHILVGGPAVRMGLNPNPLLNIRVCHQLPEVLPILDVNWPDRVLIGEENALGFRPCIDQPSKRQ